MSNMKDLLNKIREIRTLSGAAWEAAIDSATPQPVIDMLENMQEEWAKLWDEAESHLLSGSLGPAIIALEKARQLEAVAGDDVYARYAIRLAEEVVS